VIKEIILNKIGTRSREMVRSILSLELEIGVIWLIYYYFTREDNKLFSKKLAPYIFILPFFIMFGLFMVFPIIYGFWLSFHKIEMIGMMDFIGFKNYAKLFRDPIFYQSLRVLGKFVLIFGVIHLFLGLVSALLLNLEPPGKNFFRVSIFLPVTTSLVTSALIWSLLLDKDSGFLNALLEKIGFSGGYEWLTSPRLALWAIIIIATWRWFGYYMVIYLAGLQNINKTLYEAAKIDGASTLQSTIYISLPLLSPVIFYSVVMATIGSLGLFAEPYVLTGGGPAYATMSTAFYLYTNAFSYAKFGYATAMGYIMSLIIMAIAFLQVKYLGRYGGLED